MESFIENFFNTLLATAGEHVTLTYSIIFFGAILDVLPPFCFFTYGELFFIPWAILAAKWILSLPLVAFFSITGGVIWDNLSYLLGYYYWDSFLKKVMKYRYFNKYIDLDKYENFKDEFHKKWWITLFIARFSWPLAWITPFIAGSLHFPRKKFLLWNTPWAIIGISIFVFGGYFFGLSIETIWWIMQKYMFGIIWVILVGIFIKYAYTIANKKKQS